MDINKFCYEHITEKSYDGYVGHLKDNSLALDVPEGMHYGDYKIAEYNNISNDEVSKLHKYYRDRSDVYSTEKNYD